MISQTKNVFALEAQRFSQNAAEALLRRGKLVEFFSSLKYEVKLYGEGYKGLCPACEKSAIFIGTNGKTHKIYWKCYDKACPSNTGQSKLVKNLLGLVRGLVEDHRQTTAMKVIADYLGAKSTWDVTNGKLEEAAPSKDYLFIVSEEENVIILARAGHPCMILKDVRRHHQVKRIYCLFRSHEEPVEDHLRKLFSESEVTFRNPYELISSSSFEQHIVNLAKNLLEDDTLPF